ncbi:MAG TPA: hypothetical protein VNV65_04915 [Candidatus Solibacter sp.]|nr:hypothetical protein [Candidatus Solibacter sp.]
MTARPDARGDALDGARTDENGISEGPYAGCQWHNPTDEWGVPFAIDQNLGHDPNLAGQKVD